MDRPSLYIQHLSDEAEETQDAFDQLHPVIGGEPRDAYRVGVAIDEGYETDTADTLEDAETILDELLDETGVEYEMPDSLEEIVVEQRYWEA